jgi:hypothetical protein
MAGSQTQESSERAGIYINKSMALVCRFFEAAMAQRPFDPAPTPMARTKSFIHLK